MNLLLLFPAGLAALAALLMPLLIHLARRSEHRPTDFAALRWLRALPRPRHRVRLDELPLLLVRLLVLAVLAVLLAEPARRAPPDVRPRIVVSPGVDLATARALPLPNDAHWHWLAPDFPPVAAAAGASGSGTPQPVASLLREFDASLPAEAPLYVIVPTQWGALDAQRVQVSRVLQWRVLPGQSPTAGPATGAPLRLQVVADDEDAPALRYLRAVHAAWALPGALPVATPAAAVPARWAPGTVVAWLSHSTPPAAVMAWVAGGGHLLLEARSPAPPALAAPLQPLPDSQGPPLLEGATLGRGRVLRWVAPLQPLQPQQLPAVLEADFPNRLRAALQPPPLPQRAPAQTQQPQRGAAIRLTTPPWPLAPWLIGLVLLLFGIERWLATAPRRRLAA
ncbi:BatA domain-containing protein [Xanthomonas cannabis]|uniref:BatA domain-containing protein n=1 Tax=Xanthomonas cannabis TaxID=1885674 RepID=UPI0005738197|nr:BatA domain-containing protein [Xanthomonas cannabis]KHL57984.1 membrane protein [Xanthomonas cannabis pv. cannabis]